MNSAFLTLLERLRVALKEKGSSLKNIKKFAELQKLEKKQAMIKKAQDECESAKAMLKQWKAPRQLRSVLAHLTHGICLLDESVSGVGDEMSDLMKACQSSERRYQTSC